MGRAPVAELQIVVVDGILTSVLTLAELRVECAEILVALRASSVRRLQGGDLLLALCLGRSPAHAFYIDTRVLEEREVLVAVEPPHGFAKATPGRLRRTLGAHALTLGRVRRLGDPGSLRSCSTEPDETLLGGGSGMAAQRW